MHSWKKHTFSIAIIIFWSIFSACLPEMLGICRFYSFIFLSYIMEAVVLNAHERDLSILAKDVRSEKKVPGVCYGHERKNIHVTVEHEELRKVLKKAGMSTLVDLTIEGKVEKVLISDVQFHPVMDTIEHVDFHIVKLKENITTEIPLEYVGVSSAVKNFAGVLVTNLDEVEVRCLPTALVHSIQVDISKLEALGDSIHVSDLTIPAGIEILTDAEETVCLVQAPADEEVDTAPEMNVSDVQTTAQKSEETPAA